MTRRDLVEPLIVRGAVVAMPNQDVKIAALVAGRVDSLSVAEGDWVKAGQVVAEIDPRPFDDQKRQAAAARGAGEGRSSRTRGSTSSAPSGSSSAGIAAGKEVEDARAAARGGRRGPRTGRRRRSTRPTASSRARTSRRPSAGQVVKRLVSVGEQVDGTAAQPIVEVANLDHVEIAAGSPGRAPGPRAGGPARDRVVGRLRGRSRSTGEIIAIAPAVDAATNTALARIRLANPGRLLKIGMFAQAHVGLSERKGVLTVPPSAVAKGEAGGRGVRGRGRRRDAHEGDARARNAGGRRDRSTA